MEKFSKDQRKILADFFMTIAAGWFGAGVISTAFIRPANMADIAANLGMGLIFAYICLRVATFLIRGEK